MFDPAVLTQQFFNALALGSIYALVALGYTLVYGIIELINFAHGDVFMVGTFTAMWFITTILMMNRSIEDPVLLIGVLLLVFTVVMIFLGVVGVIIERFAYRPLRRAPRLAPLLTAIGVSFILQNLIQVIFGPSPETTPKLFPNIRFQFLGANISLLAIFIFALTISLIIALQFFVNRTRLGRAMRSTAQDREAAQLMGVDINRTIATTFFIGSALAGAGSVVYGLYYGQIVFTLGFSSGLKAFTAAVLGGIGNTTGAAFGGFFIGFVEVYASHFGYARWSSAFVFGILILVLVFRPSGLFGQQLGERA
ncbi:MAG TPA: branched-chain amino acid ABC transporter permease [Candidatus Limnocylindria bacterium]